MEPCPLCKSTDTEVLREHDSSTGSTSLLNYCKACGCCAPPSAWNTRPADPQPSAREAALEEALKNADQFLLAVSIAHTDYVKNWTLHMTEAGTNLKRSIEALRSNAPGKGADNA